jgi:hypothetical protein
MQQSYSFFIIFLQIPSSLGKMSISQETPERTPHTAFFRVKKARPANLRTS